MAVVTTNAQGHLKFNGVEIDGNLTSFVQKMSEKGFVKEYSSPDGSTIGMKGVFLDEDVVLMISADSQNKIVNGVLVGFIANEDTPWRTLEHDYNNLVDLYTEKYGEPIKQEEYFDSPFDVDYLRRGSEKLALDRNKCHYTTYFQLENGNILISIHKEGVSVSYFDNINLKISNETSHKRNLDDI
jgi:hypothetical protein